MTKFFFLILIGLLGCAKLPLHRSDKLSILQGPTTGGEIEFSIISPLSKVLRFELRNIKGEIFQPEIELKTTKPFSNYALHKILFTKNENEDLNLYVFEGDKIIDQRLVHKEIKNQNELTLILASGIKDPEDEALKLWEEIHRQNPDLILFVGDVSFKDPEELWEKYLHFRLSVPIFFKEKLIPMSAIWDQSVPASEKEKYSPEDKKEVLEIFKSFWAHHLLEDSWVKGEGPGGLLTLGDFNFYLLDGRSFRDSDPMGLHLGKEQEEWLFQKLTDQPGPSFIIKGDPFFGGYNQEDSFETSHPQNFSTFTDRLANLLTPFVFVSASPFFSEIMQFPRSLFKRPSFEITTGPLSGSESKKFDKSNPWLVVKEQDRPNFIKISNSAKDNHWFLDVESFGASGESYFKRELAVYIKDLQNNLNEIRKKRRSGRRKFRRFYKRRRNGSK